MFDIFHMTIALCIVVLSIGIIWITRRKALLQQIVTGLLITILLSSELLSLFYSIHLRLWDYHWGLSLQLCDLAVIAVVISLLTQVQWIWELAYFWGAWWVAVRCADT